MLDSKGPGLNSGRETKISQAMWLSQKKKKQNLEKKKNNRNNQESTKYRPFKAGPLQGIRSPEDAVIISVQFSSVTQLCPTLCDPMDCSRPGLPVHHQLPEFTQTHVHRVSDAIQPSHPLSSPSPPTFNLSQHRLFKWVSSLQQVARVLEFQLQHQSFQWIFRTDFF